MAITQRAEDYVGRSVKLCDACDKRMDERTRRQNELKTTSPKTNELNELKQNRILSLLRAFVGIWECCSTMSISFFVIVVAAADDDDQDDD